MLEFGHEKQAEMFLHADYQHQAFELLEQFCDLLSARVDMMDNKDKQVPTELLEAVTSIVWGSSRVDVPELKTVTKELSSRYGSKFVKEVESSAGLYVNANLQMYLGVTRPEDALIMNLLTEIATKNAIPDFSVAEAFGWKEKV